MTDQAQMGRNGHQGRRGCLAVGDSVRGGIEPPLVHGGEFRTRALPAEEPLVRSPDPHARPEPIHLGADLHHFPREITAHDVGKPQGHRHGAGPDVGIDRIDRGGPHPHQGLPRTGHRIGKFPR